MPSTHSGGELIIKHLGREVMLDPHPEEPSEIGFAAFYADCVHEVRPVTAGDNLVVVTTIENIRVAAGNDILTTRADISTVDGEPVVTTWAVTVARGTAAEESA